MGPLNLSEIPGYKEALEHERICRELSFVSNSIPLCGVEITHLSARKMLLLNGLGCRFLKGDMPQVEDVWLFFWVLSPSYTRNIEQRDQYIKTKLNDLKYIESVKAIYAYLEDVFVDRPPSGGTEEVSYWASVAGLCHTIAENYGWDDEAILDKPLARLFQYMKIIRHKRNPKEPRFNRSDKMKSELLARMNAPQS